MTDALANGAGDADQLYLELDGRRLPVLIRKRTTTTSIHTSAPLDELHVWAVTSDQETHAWLSEALKKAVEIPVQVTDAADEHVGRWTLSWNAYGEVAGEHRYTLILRECEDLNLEALVVDGTELHPYEYREELAGGGLTIWAKLVGSLDEVTMLRRLFRANETAAVVRRGIEDEPRYMHLGVGEWTEFEDRIKYRLVLVETGVDDESHPELARIRRQNSRAALGFYMNFAERLVSLLIAKGVLDEVEVEAVREAASFEAVTVRNDFWRVVPELDDR